MTNRHVVVAFVVIFVAAVAAHAQVAKPTVPGVTNFVKVDSTIAVGGATTAAGVAEVKKLGYAAIVDLRQASEPGANVEAEAAAAKEADIRFIHLPLSGASPEPAAVDQFLKAVADPANQPTFVHCMSGNRAAALLLIKRMVVDGWDAERASTEAAAAGLSSASLKAFALDYASRHARK